MSPYASAVLGGLSVRSKLATASWARAVSAASIVCSGVLVVFVASLWAAAPVFLLNYPLVTVWGDAEHGRLASYAAADWAKMAGIFALGAALYLRMAAKAAADPELAMMGAAVAGQPWSMRFMTFIMGPVAYFIRFISSGQAFPGGLPVPPPIQVSIDPAKACLGWFQALRQGLSAQPAMIKENVKYCWEQGVGMGSAASAMMAALASPLSILYAAAWADWGARAFWAKFKAPALATPAGAASVAVPAPTAAKRWLDGLAADGVDRFAASEAKLLDGSSKAASSEGDPPRL